MRKLLLSATMIASSLSLFAQKLDDVQENISKGKYNDAKEKLDKFLADPKNQNNANAYYYQGVIYNSLAKDSTKRDMGYSMQAFNAFKRYQELDPKNVMMTLNNNVGLFQIYGDYYNTALAAYNAQQFDKAFENFKNTLEVEKYIVNKGYTFPNITLSKLDTNLIVNTGNMALRAKMEDSAMKYYSMLADAKIKGDNYEQIYQMLVDYYSRKNDNANLTKYLAIGKELYPNNETWLESELTPLKDDKQKLFAKYKELIAANPGKYFLNYNYAVELFNYIYANDKKPADAQSMNPDLEGAISKAISINSTPEANMLMVRYLTEQVYKQEDAYRAVKGNTPADASKRKAANAQKTALNEKLIPYAQAVYKAYDAKTDLKGAEKGNLRYVTNILIDYYTTKKQMDKVTTYQNKLKTL